MAPCQALQVSSLSLTHQDMKYRGYLAATLMALSVPMIASAGDGYKITGKSGFMYFVAIDKAQKDNEDIYRFAVGIIRGQTTVFGAKLGKLWSVP